MKPLIVGEQPSHNGDHTKPCEGRVGQRLADLSGITFERYLELFDRRNIFNTDRPVGSFASVLARQQATQLLPLFQGRYVLLLGKRVANAFMFRPAEYFFWREMSGGQVVVVPHPSGLSRWYNDLDNEFQMLRFMHRLMTTLKERQ